MFLRSARGDTKSKAKIFKFDVNLLLIKCDDFFRANMNNFTFYTEHAGVGKIYASEFINGAQIGCM